LGDLVPGLGSLIGLAAAASWIYLIVFRGRFWCVGPSLRPGTAAGRRVVAVIPARDEAELLPLAVTSLLQQRYRGPLDIVVVDDHSSDDTAAAAQAAAAACGYADRLTVASAAPLPPDWTGKLWAMHQGIAVARRSNPDYLLLTDADIVHSPDTLVALVSRAEDSGADLVSLMVWLNCASVAERLLIPAFVFFFFKLFPPRWVADPRRRTAAAAGGCMLVRLAALDRMGGVADIRGEIIDDCALARRIKQGGSIWLGAAADTRSVRPYHSVQPIWSMIMRSAFAQLGYSPAMLLATMVLMAIIYLMPPVLVVTGPLTARVLGGVAWLAMSCAFLPTLRLYRCSPAMAPLLPAMALFYMAATIGSAVQYWRGRGGQWKGRSQAARS
jgi:hopene-associated glycosyltransferase HpnB